MKKNQKYTKNVSLLGIISILLLTGCYERKKFPEPKVEQRTVGALISDLRQPQGARPFDPLFANFSTLKAAIQKLGLDDLLRDNSKNFIVFAPDNLAFDQLRSPFNNATDILSIRSRDNNGDVLQPGYNDSLMLRAIILNHVVEVVNNNEFSVSNQTTFSSVAVQPAFLPATNPLNIPWVNNTIRLEPAKGVQGGLNFVPPRVNGSLMFSWGTKASNGVLNTISNVLFPANTNDFLRVDGRYGVYAGAIDGFTDLVGYLSDPNSSITLFAPFIASIPTPLASLRAMVQAHILAPSLGRLQVSDLNTSRTIPKYLPNFTTGRSTGFIFVGSGCLGASVDVLRTITDAQPIPTPTITVGIGPTSYGPGCEAFGFTSFVSTSNGNVFHTTGILNPQP